MEYSTRENTLEWFEGARLGIFIHWDARSDCAKENINGEMDIDVRPYSKRMQERAMWGDSDNPPKTKPWQKWNPSRFNAKEWVDVIEASGAKYFTFTAMHAWCLSNFDHPATRYDIMSTPFGRDAAAELAQAAKDRDVVAMWYFNMFTSKHIKGKGERETHFWKLAEKDFRKTKNWEDFRKAGLHALITNTDKYGKIAGIWCDGGGKFTPEGAKGFYETILDVQPWLIFSPRHGHPDMPKDYKVPEQKMPAMNWELHQEMTMPIESDMWFWTLGKKANTKDAEYTIQTLIQTATRDANLMINISPRGDGSIDETQRSVLRELGKWLKIYGESIYETRGGPYGPGIWGGSTRKGNKVYLHLTQLSQAGTYMLPKLPAKIESYRLLGNRRGGLQVNNGKELTVRMDPAITADKGIVDRIVELTLSKDAWQMLPNNVITVDDGKFLKTTATASSENTYNRPSNKAVTDHASNVTARDAGHGGWTASEVWSEQGADPNPWLMLDLGGLKNFSQIYLKEYHSRIQKFVVEYRASVNFEWKTLTSGKRLNHLSLKLDRPVAARFVRVRFPETAGGAPQIGSFHIYE
ncbi:MAG: alpha-L-fucosidase [Kiritimatiellales bacterium]|nr:alpha-L-fucosidase [Kiritimatiellales bacterium]